MNEMIERVARVLCANGGYDPDSEHMFYEAGIERPGKKWHLYAADASDAIAAMREPTAEMVRVMTYSTPSHLLDSDMPEMAVRAWQDGIDAALAGNAL